MAVSPDAELLDAARAVRSRAHAPYSGFGVGAAGRSAAGGVYAATNVESASFVSGVCAETALVGSMVADGVEAGEIAEVVVVGPNGEFVAPCGRCRQLLHELGGESLVVNGRTMDDWLPDAFSGP